MNNGKTTACDKHESVKIEFESPTCPLCASQSAWPAIAAAGHNIGMMFVQAALQTPIQLSVQNGKIGERLTQGINHQLNELAKILNGGELPRITKPSLIVPH